jgi:hypothetical protein
VAARAATRFCRRRLCAGDLRRGVELEAIRRRSFLFRSNARAMAEVERLMPATADERLLAEPLDRMIVTDRLALHRAISRGVRGQIGVVTD